MRIKFLILGLLIVFAVSAQEQKDSIMRFTLEQAKAYALENSPTVKNSELDLIAAKKKIWETTAIGLPQASADYSYSYMLTVSPLIKQLSQFSAMGGDSGSNGDINSFRSSSILDVTVSQLIFSGSYIVGLQTSKVYKGLSELALTKSKDELAESINNSYVLVLVAKENKSLLDSTYMNTNNILSNMRKMQQQGLLDITDIDQLQLTVNSLKNAADLMGRQALISERLLKFQMGMDLDMKIELTDSISGLVSDYDKSNLLLQSFNLESNVNYKLLDTQSKLMNLNLRYNKSSFLPSIAAFYQHEENFNKKAISFTPPDLIGFRISIPIFSSGQRLAKVSQAKIDYNKSLNTKKQASDGLIVEYEQSKSAYISALDKHSVAKDNLKLSENIYNRSLAKYREGMISSIELTQTQNQYIQSQSNYYSAIIELASAKAKLEKILKSAQ